MGSKKISIKGILGNNKLLLLISFLLACILWIVFSQSTTKDSTTSIYDVPVSIELSDQAQKEGLQIYRGNEATASVQIKGNRLTVGSVTKDDLQVIAQGTSSISTPTTQMFSLAARKNPNSVKDFEIVSVSPNMVNVYIDKERQKEFTIENLIDISNIKIPVEPAEYYLGKPTLSSDKVIVTGPEAEMKKVNKVVVREKIEGEQTKTITLTKEVVLLDAYGEELTREFLTVSPESVEVTISIMPQKEVPIKPVFTNVPAGINVDSLVKVTPATIPIAGSQSALDKISEIELDPIDFSKLSPNDTTKELNINLPNGIMGISNDKQATVAVDLTGYDTTKIPIKKIGTTGLQSGYTVQMTTSSIAVEIVGPTDVISELDADNIQATANLSKLGDDPTGYREVQVTVKILGASKCWSYKDYTVNVYIQKKE